MFCDNCGAEIESDSKFCDSCGKALELPVTGGQPNTALTALDSTEHRDRKPYWIVGAVVLGLVVLVFAGPAIWNSSRTAPSGRANNGVIGSLIGSQSNGPSHSEIENQLRNQPIDAACYRIQGMEASLPGDSAAFDDPVLRELQNRGFIQIYHERLQVGVELIGSAPIYKDMAGFRLTDKGRGIACQGGLRIPVRRDIEIVSVSADAGTAYVEYNQTYQLEPLDGSLELAKSMFGFGLRSLGTPQRMTAIFYRFGGQWKLQ